MQTDKSIKVLIVDDEIRMCRTLEILLQSEGGFKVDTAHNAIEALQKLEDTTDVVVTDISMPGRDGMSLLKEIKERAPNTRVVMMTAYSTVDSAVEAIKTGAFEYLVKPFDNEKFLEVVKRAGQKESQTKINKEIKRSIDKKKKFGELIGGSKALKGVYYLMERAAQTDSTVLITGESGTGKELVARAIHYNGKRKNGPFVVVNCTALPETLLESELFGHIKGAFTGADKDREGRFSIAHTGTIFLDEIGELPPSLQVKFLRVLQEKTFEPVGSTTPKTVDVRVIAATNRDLEKSVKDGSFREDLYYRLKVLHIHLPPLRERKEDILLLADYFLNKKTREAGGGPKKFSEETKTRLLEYDFPGNVRELENMVERAIVLCTSNEITPADMPELLNRRKGDTGSIMNIPIKDGWKRLSKIHSSLEKDLLQRAVEQYGHLSNQQLADLLGTSRRVLELRLKEYGIKKKDH